jgi:ubiquinone/menaquinone biosynthesis C-methylase UbiE
MVEGGVTCPPGEIEADEVIRRWNEAAEEYARFSLEDEEYFHKHLVNPALLEMLGDIRGCSVLDLACGDGHFSRKLAELSGGRVSITAVDASEAMVRIAAERHRSFSHAIRFQVADACSLAPLAAGPFDFVVCNMALMDIKDYAGAIRAVARVLKPSGEFLFSVLHPCFQTPGSGWITEESPHGKRRNGWKVDNYFLRLAHVGRAKLAMEKETCYFHRALEDYFTALGDAGFAVVDLREPPPNRELIENEPDGQRFLGMSLFLVVKAVHRSATCA